MLQKSNFRIQIYFSKVINTTESKSKLTLIPLVNQQTSLYLRLSCYRDYCYQRTVPDSCPPRPQRHPPSGSISGSSESSTASLFSIVSLSASTSDNILSAKNSVTLSPTTSVREKLSVGSLVLGSSSLARE